MQEATTRMYIGNIQSVDGIDKQIKSFLTSIGSYQDLELNFKLAGKVFGFFTVNQTDTMKFLDACGRKLNNQRVLLSYAKKKQAYQPPQVDLGEVVPEPPQPTEYIDMYHAFEITPYEQQIFNDKYDFERAKKRQVIRGTSFKRGHKAILPQMQ